MEYLQTLYRMFGKWYLVMMAYNCGEGRLQKAIQKAGSDDFATLMNEKAAFIPKETRNYLRKILLLSMMGEKIQRSPEKKDIKIRDLILPATEVAVNIYGGITLERLAELLRMNPGRLARLNPQLAGGRIDADLGLTQIFIPVDRLAYYDAFYQPPTLEEIFRKKGYTRLVAHIVRRGETLRSIARAYRVTPLDLIIANQLATTRVEPDTIVMVPVTPEEYAKRVRY
jgi:membrane-bound lytic murein transglycosylase D